MSLHGSNQGMSISREEFMNLRAGDVIVWNCNGASPSFRTVIEGPRDDTRPKPSPHISLMIRRRSWTGRPTTGYFWNDVKHTIKYTGRNRCELFSEEELERVLKLGLKPRAELLERLEDRQRERPHWIHPDCIRGCSKRLSVMAQRALQGFQFADIK